MMTEPRQLTIEERDGTRIVRFAGELDTFAAASHRARLLPLGRGDRVVADLSELTFVDSAGLHALFELARAARESGASIVFVVPTDSPVRKVLEIVQLADVSPVLESLHLAIERISSERISPELRGD